MPYSAESTPPLRLWISDNPAVPAPDPEDSADRTLRLSAVLRTYRLSGGRIDIECAVSLAVMYFVAACAGTFTGWLRKPCCRCD